MQPDRKKTTLFCFNANVNYWGNTGEIFYSTLTQVAIFVSYSV